MSREQQLAWTLFQIETILDNDEINSALAIEKIWAKLQERELHTLVTEIVADIV